VTEKCICDGWEWESFESWSTCPNCDFPADRLVWVKNLMSTADKRLELLRRCNELLKHAPEFPYHLIVEYDIEELQKELAEELGDE
jgi:hypothetical protein